MFKTLSTAALALAMGFVFAGPVHADSSRWGPAYGYRDKHDDDGHYRKWRKHERYHRRHGDYDDGSGRYYRDSRGRGGVEGVVGRCSRGVIGSAIGAGTGAIIGTRIGKGDGRTAAIVGGAIAGAILGGQIGRAVDDADRYCMERAPKPPPTSSNGIWKRPNRQTRYEVPPLANRRTLEGRYCREYVTTATIAGRRQQVYGTACRQPDGSWEVVDGRDTPRGRLRSYNIWRPL